MTAPANLRAEMPQTAAFIAELRAALCETPEEVRAFNAQIRAGMDGQPTFWARENGFEVGTPDRQTRRAEHVVMIKAPTSAKNPPAGLSPAASPKAAPWPQTSRRGG